MDRGCYNCGDSSHQARDCPKRGTPVWYLLYVLDSVPQMTLLLIFLHSYNCGGSSSTPLLDLCRHH